MKRRLKRQNWRWVIRKEIGDSETALKSLSHGSQLFYACAHCASSKEFYCPGYIYFLYAAFAGCISEGKNGKRGAVAYSSCDRRDSRVGFIVFHSLTQFWHRLFVFWQCSNLFINIEELFMMSWLISVFRCSMKAPNLIKLWRLWGRTRKMFLVRFPISVLDFSSLRFDPTFCRV